MTEEGIQGRAAVFLAFLWCDPKEARAFDCDVSGTPSPVTASGSAFESGVGQSCILASMNISGVAWIRPSGWGTQLRGRGSSLDRVGLVSDSGCHYDAVTKITVPRRCGIRAVGPVRALKPTQEHGRQTVLAVTEIRLLESQQAAAGKVPGRHGTCRS